MGLFLMDGILAYSSWWHLELIFMDGILAMSSWRVLELMGIDFMAYGIIWFQH